MDGDFISTRRAEITVQSAELISAASGEPIVARERRCGGARSCSDEDACRRMMRKLCCAVGERERPRARRSVAFRRVDAENENNFGKHLLLIRQKVPIYSYPPSFKCTNFQQLFEKLLLLRFNFAR